MLQSERARRSRNRTSSTCTGAAVDYTSTFFGTFYSLNGYLNLSPRLQTRGVEARARSTASSRVCALLAGLPMSAGAAAVRNILDPAPTPPPQARPVVCAPPVQGFQAQPPRFPAAQTPAPPSLPTLVETQVDLKANRGVPARRYRGERFCNETVACAKSSRTLADDRYRGIRIHETQTQWENEQPQDQVCADQATQRLAQCQVGAGAPMVTYTVA